MLNLRRALKDYEESGAMNAHIAVHEAVGAHSFLTKSGHLLQMLGVSGIDDECLEPGQVDQIAQRMEAAFRLLDEDFRLYQCLIKAPAKPIEYRKCGLPVVDQALTGRAASLNAKGLHRIDLYWVVDYEGGRFGSDGNGPLSLLKQPAKELKRLLSAETTQENLERELERSIQVLAQRVCANDQMMSRNS
jgi:type IV secretory pathway VirB4 component